MIFKPEKMFESFGQRLSKCRKEKGITQEKLAEKLNTSHDKISKLERGVQEPGLTDLKLLAEELDVSVQYLACGREPSAFPDGLSGALSGLKQQQIASLNKIVLLLSGLSEDQLNGISGILSLIIEHFIAE